MQLYDEITARGFKGSAPLRRQVSGGTEEKAPAGANVIATFNNARQQEGCTVSLSIDPVAYDTATPQMQQLMLVNAERQDRGLGALQLDTTLMSQIDFNHSSEMAQYNYQAHSSPIDEPGATTVPLLD